MKTLWTKLKNAFRSLLAGTKQLFYVVWTASKKELADVLNDPQLQEMALEAVRVAAARKLSGDEAWKEAFAMFRAYVGARKYQLGTAILETILQTAYTVYKYTEGNGKDSTIPTGPEV